MAKAVTKSALVVPDEVVPSSKQGAKRTAKLATVELQSTPVDRAKAGRLEASALAKVQEAKQIKVGSVAAYKDAAEFCVGLKEGEKAIEELYGEPVKKAHELHKSLTGARKKLLEPLQEARQIVQGKMGAWDLAQREKAQEEARIEAEKQRLLEIKEAKKDGDRELVKELQAAPVIAAPVAAPTPKVAGVVSREVWKFEVVNEGIVPRKFMSVDERKIKAEVDRLGEGAEIAGVRVWKEVQTFTRSS